MNNVLFDYLDDFCTAYLDDILIYSDNELEHEHHVRKVLERLRNAGLQIDLKKCEFHVTRTKYLGFIISIDGIEVDPDKITIVRDWKAPTTIKGVQSFLGFCNFYRRFIRNYGIIARPIVNLTRTGVKFIWTQACQDSFLKLKAMLTSAPILQHYSEDLETRIETDASDSVVAGVLSQKHREHWLPVAFFSKTMNPAKCNYQIHDKEILAIVKSLEEWRPELQRKQDRFEIYTDHKSLEYFMTTKQLTARQARWAEALSEYYFIITYRPGKDNVQADALTRRSDDVANQDQLKKATRQQILLTSDKLDPRIVQGLEEASIAVLAPMDATATKSFLDTATVVDRVLQANRDEPSLEALRIQATKSDPYLTLHAGILLYQGKVIVPDVDCLRTHLIREVHDQISTAHPGRDKTYRLLKDRYYWRGMLANVERYVRNCHPCRRASSPRDKTPGLLQLLPVPDRPWQHISMDFNSFNRDKHGYDNVLVIMDRLSKESISIPCHKTTTAEEMASLFIYHVWRYFGPPDSIVSDRGPQFISAFWTEFCRLLGVKIKLSTAHHPQTDSQTEIMNQYLEQRLRPFVNYYQDNWSELLPMMDYAQLTLPHSSIGMSPFEVRNGFKARTSFDWSTPEPSSTPELNSDRARQRVQLIQDSWKLARDVMARSQAKMAKSANAHRREVDFDVEDHVWLNTKYWNTARPSLKLDNKNSGPFEIIAKEGHSFRLKLPASMKINPVMSPDKLRKAAGDPLPGQVNKPEDPVEIAGDIEYEVEEILAVRKRWKRLEYRVKWKGYEQEDLEWYPPSDLKGAPHKLKTFHLNYPRLPGPPLKLEEWITAWEDGLDEYEHLNDDRAMTGPLRTAFFKRGG